MSYEELHDVEQGLMISDDTIIALARERYSVINSDSEALFLGRIDHVMNHLKLEIKIPRLHTDRFVHDDETRATNFANVLNSLKLPTFTFFVTLSLAVLSILSNNPFCRAAFPYLSCLLTFWSTVPFLRKRWLAKSSLLFTQFDSTQRQAEDAVDQLTSSCLQTLKATESTMNQALAPIQTKLAAVTRVESMLKQVNPDIDIPDPSDVKRSFDGFHEKLQAGFSRARKALDVSRSLPLPFQSAENFELYLVNPYLAVMLVIQLVVVYVTTLNKQNHVPLAESIVENDERMNDWHLIGTALQAYTTAIIQIALAFGLTQTQSLIILVNKEIGVMETNMNHELRRSVGGVFDEIFRRGFQIVKSRFLDLLKKMNRLEEPLRKLQATFPDVFDNPEFSELLSVFKKDLTGKLQKKRKNMFQRLSKIFGK